MATTFNLSFLAEIGVCYAGLERVKAFGGAIENTRAGWLAYIASNPDAWRAPVYAAWALKFFGWAIDPDLVWKIARLAFREAGKVDPALAQYAETLGPENWREAQITSITSEVAFDAYVASSLYTTTIRAALAAAHAAYDVYTACYLQDIKSEIVELAVAALIAADPNKE